MQRPHQTLVGFLLAVGLPLLFSARLHADGERETDAWVGRWNVEIRFPDEQPLMTWVQIAPRDGGGYNVRTASGKPTELLVLTKDHIEFRILDEGKSSFRVNLKGKERFSGTVDQPGNDARSEGEVTGRRAHAFGGFYLAGPRRLRWGQKAEYRLQYARDGARRDWFGGARWKVDSRPPRTGLLQGDVKAAVRVLSIPPAPSAFAQMRVRLRVSARGNEEFADVLDDAKLIVLVTDVPENCQALRGRINELETAMRTLRGRLAELEARGAALEFPTPWDPSTAKALDRKIASEREMVGTLEKNRADVEATLERLRRTERAIDGYRAALHRISNPKGRAFYGLGWYKHQGGSPDDRVEFVRYYSGERVRRADRDAIFEAQYIHARSIAVKEVGRGLVEIGGLVTLLPTGGSSSLRTLMGDWLQRGFQFALSTHVGSEAEAGTLSSALRGGEVALRQFLKRHDEIHEVVLAHEKASTGRERHELEVRLNRLALKAGVAAIGTSRAIREARDQARRARRDILRALRTQSTTLAQLERQREKETLAEEDRLAEGAEVRIRKERIDERLERTAEALGGRSEELELLREMYARHCAPGQETDDPVPASAPFSCRRGRILASSFFDGGTNGWTIVGDGEDFKAVGGHIQAHDQGRGRHWHFRAPAAYLGNKRAAYGYYLTFELNQLKVGAPTFGDRIVVLSDGETELIYEPTPEPPAHGWTRFEVCLHESSHWRSNQPGGKVSKELFRSVLGNLTSLYVNCEHSTHHDTGGLRDVILYGARTD